MTPPPPADANLVVLVVDDHSMLAEALRLSLTGGPTDAIDVVVADDLEPRAVLDLAATAHPDLVLVDLDLGGTRSGIELVDPLTTAGYRVVLFTGSTDQSLLGDGLAAGATGVLRKTEPFGRLIDGITDAAHGLALTRPTERDELLAASRSSRESEARREGRLESLTPRERAILGRLAEGHTAAQIATDDFVALATVRSQVKAILRKLGVNSQLAAVAFARSS